MNVSSRTGLFEQLLQQRLDRAMDEISAVATSAARMGVPFESRRR